MCVCVLHIEPFFLPVDIQHNQCPCLFFNPRDKKGTSGVYCYAVSREDNAMPGYRTGTRQARLTHSMKERKIERNETHTYRKKKVSCPPPGYVADKTDTSKRNSTTAPPHPKSIKTKNLRKEQANRSTTRNKTKANLQVAAAAVCGTSRVYRFYLATLSAVSFLLSSTVPHPRGGGVRQYKQTKQARHPPTTQEDFYS